MANLRKRYILVAAVAIVLAGIAIPVALQMASPPAEPFFLVRVLTWNVGRAYGLGDSRADTRSLDEIARTIADSDVDAAVLQEIKSPWQLDRLLEALGGEYTGGISERERTDRAIVLLVRGVGTFTPVPSKAGRPKIAATFDADARDEVTVVGVHLSAFDPLRRRAEALEIVEFVRTRPERTIVAGDFNLDARDPTSGETDRETYDAISGELRDLGATAGATALLGRRIDYVFGRPAEVVEAGPRIVLGKRHGRMDHEPLLVHVALRRRPS